MSIFTTKKNLLDEVVRMMKTFVPEDWQPVKMGIIEFKLV